MCNLLQVRTDITCQPLRNHTCSTRSPLQTTIVGTRSFGSSSSSVGERSSRYRGTTNSSSHVHLSQILSMHGTQHLAESGAEGVVYACGTRFTYIRQEYIVTFKTYIWIRFGRKHEFKTIDRIAKTVCYVDN